MTHEDFEGIDVKQELRAARSQPDEEFASRLAERVRREHRRPRATPRTALAFAATIVALAVVGAFGGISEAAATLSNAVTSIVHVSKPSKPHATKAHARTGGSSSLASSGSSSSGQRISAGGGGAQAPSPLGAASPAEQQYTNGCTPGFRGPYIACRIPLG